MTEYNRSYLHKIHLFILSYISISFSVWVIQYLIKFLRKFYVYDEMFDKVLAMLGKRAVKFERLKIRSNFMCR